MKRLLVLVTALTAICASAATSTRADLGPEVPRPLTPERLPRGPVPGKQVRGSFRVPQVGTIHHVRELIAAGSGQRRTALLIARGKQGQLCLTAVVGRRARRATFDCLDAWDRPPLLVRVGVGGHTRRRADWIAAIGLVRRGVKRVSVETEGFTRARPRLRAWAGFPWRAFATGPGFGRRKPYFVFAHDASRHQLQEVSLSWADRAPCDESQHCTRRERHAGRWSAARDPLASQQSSRANGAFGKRALQIAFDHPTVRQLVTNQPFSFLVAEWRKCNGDPIGVIAELFLTQPLSFEADLPAVTFQKTQATAYLEGIARWRVRRNVWFHVHVDVNRGQVVAIFPEGEPSNLSEGRKWGTKIEFLGIGPLHPAGGPDTGSCVSEGD
jgi:hypothetical protein